MSSFNETGSMMNWACFPATIGEGKFEEGSAAMAVGGLRQRGSVVVLSWDKCNTVQTRSSHSFHYVCIVDA